MPSARLLAAAVLIAALAFPTAAGASQSAPKVHRSSARTARQTNVNPLKAAAAVGLRYWGMAPCNGQIKVAAKRPLPAGLDTASDAWVTFDSPWGANDLAAPASTYANCAIAFASSRWPTTASMREDWDMFCLTMIHEQGHLLGKVHDSTPGSVMAPVFTDHSSVPAICKTSRPGRSVRASRKTRQRR